MKRPAIGKDLVPVNEFRANMASWMHHLESSGRPVVLTQRGKAAAVLVDPSMLDELESAREVVQRVLAGLEEAEAGALHAEQEVWAEVEAVIVNAEAKTRASSLD